MAMPPSFGGTSAREKTAKPLVPAWVPGPLPAVARTSVAAAPPFPRWNAPIGASEPWLPSEGAAAPRSPTPRAVACYVRIV
jgi:hypothetical protein